MITSRVWALPAVGITNPYTGAYQVLTAGLQEPAYRIRILNNTGSLAAISFDGGTTDHDFIPAGGVLDLFAPALALPATRQPNFPQGMPISIVLPDTAIGGVILSAYTYYRS